MLIRQIASIGRKYRHLGRYREIVSVLVRHGFGDLATRMGLRRRLPWPRRSSSVTDNLPTSAARIRLAMEELGPTFVKLGQLLSTRHDILPPSVILELEKLQDAVPPFPAAAARLIIEAELRRPLKELFTEFNDVPAGSASIAQVHNAETPAGEKVVVKIRRPGIERMVETDLEIMADLARMLERNVPEIAAFEPARIVQEFAKTLRRELDFGVEASYIEQFARNFSGDARVHVPKVLRPLSTSRVLTMERIGGVKVSHVAEFAGRGLNPVTVAARGAELVIEQIFRHGFFHADPHPGNVRVLDGNVVCFLDYGMMGHLTSRQREQLGNLVIGLAARDERRITEAVFHLANHHDHEHIGAIEAEILAFIETQLCRPLREIRTGLLLNELARILIRYKIRLPSEFFLLSKALATIEGVGRRLDPEFDVMKAAEPFARRLVRERFGPRGMARRLADAAREFQELARTLPSDVSDIMAKFKNGEAKLRLEHRNLDTLARSLDQVSNRVSFAIVLAALLIGSAIIVHSRIPPMWHGLPVIGVLGFGVSFLMGFSLLYSILKHGKM
jgi:ubiquinone biosynthesis protein